MSSKVMGYGICAAITFIFVVIVGYSFFCISDYPEVYLDDFKLTKVSFKLENTDDTMDYNVIANITFRNQNPRSGIYFDVIEFNVVYQQQTAKTEIEGFYLNPKNTKNVNVVFEGVDQFPPSDLYEGQNYILDMKNDGYEIDFKVRLKIRFTTWPKKWFIYKVRYHCDSSNANFEKTKCMFDIKKP